MVERLPEEQARQGSKGRPVLYVLIASLVLIAVATVGLLTWNGATAPPDYASRSQNAARDTVRPDTTGSLGGKATPAPSEQGAPGATQPAHPTTGNDKPQP